MGTVKAEFRDENGRNLVGRQEGCGRIKNSGFLSEV